MSIFIGVISLPVKAQITITSADLPTIGLQVIRAVDDITLISPGNPGNNQVWDFTNLIAAKFDTTLYLPVDGTPNFQNYPDAEVAIRHLNGNQPPYWDYEFIRYDDQGMRYVGDEDMLTIFGAFTMSIHIACNPNPHSLKLPFNYGDSYTQQSTYEWLLASHNAGVLMDSIKQVSHMEITTTGDASGIISTPFGSYEALRVKDEIISQDSVFNWTPNGWVFDRFEVSNYSNYKWYTNDYYEVGFYNIDETKGNSMTFFKSETVVGTSSPDFKPNFIISPNPASQTICIEGWVTPDRIEILDLTGSLVFSGTGSKVIQISDLKPGLYFVRIFSGNQTELKKLIKN
jgi:hypothetical protein